ncbi:putative RING finger protein 32 [Blattamonas nauphoetae]|uniref:RING finger protein 32 n=1 Tax=Blattamonas nauphoetae TaxID=2049346 RepID=A0ABQ9YHN2_9EUKA|nr:putative RING finger protein 32 [Blattamonas nauphoetae]
MHRRRDKNKTPIDYVRSAALQDQLLRQYSLTSETDPKFKPAPLIPQKDRPPITLAQRLGLEPAPAPFLTQNDWKVIKLESDQRDERTCAICRELFGNEDDQVLLPCTHTFHKNCLATFHSFVGNSSCPICRHHNIHNEHIHITSALDQRKNESAVIIQKWWRGYLVRRVYRIQPRDQTRRRQLTLRKMSYLSFKMDRNTRQEQKYVNKLLKEVDSNVDQNRHMMAQVIVVDWESVKQRGLVRITEDPNCPICICPLVQVQKISKPRPQPKPKQRGKSPSGTTEQFKKLAILSCSHIFHSCCLHSFETLSGQKVPICPICRAHYTTMEL